MRDGGSLRIADSASEVALAAATQIAGLLTDAVQERGEGSLAVSGGSTPRATLEVLASLPVDWSRVTIFQVDERVAPDGDPSRNLNMLVASLVTGVVETGAASPTVHAMPVTDTPIDDAANRYAQLLPACIDVVQLGLGSDGHTASLVPHDLVLTEVARSIAVTGEYQGTRRMTMTASTIRSAAHRVWVVTGAGKREALGQLRDRDPAIPAALVLGDEDAIYADIAAVT